MALAKFVIGAYHVYKVLSKDLMPKNSCSKIVAVCNTAQSSCWKGVGLGVTSMGMCHFDL